MNNKIFATLVASLLIAGQSQGAVKEYNCELNFEFDSAEVDGKEIRTCLKSVKSNEVKFFHIFATASYPGTLRYNRELSDKRADAIRAEIVRRFPNAKIETMGGGESPMGQKARVFALTASSETMAVSSGSGVSAVKQAPNKPAATRNRFAVRGGVDQFKDSDTNYRTVGAEISRRTNTYKNRYFGEYGVGINHHSDDEMLDLYSVNAFTGAYAKRGIAVAGVRGFAGNMALENNKDNVLNVGAELRAGVESNRYSAFLTGGTSKETHAVGLDVGVKF